MLPGPCMSSDEKGEVRTESKEDALHKPLLEIVDESISLFKCKNSALVESDLLK